MKPVVKESEKNRILSTTDYGLFILPDYKLSSKFLSEIEDSFSTKNLSKDYPILVEDKTYRILDGRYRFVISTKKKLPIYYKIAEVASIYDVIRIKNLVKRSDYYLVIKTFSDLLEPYNDLLVLTNDLFPEIPLQYVIKATKTACHDKHCNTIDHKKFQSGKLEQFDFEETKRRLQTISLFHSYFESKIEEEILFERMSETFGGGHKRRVVKLSWSDAFLICRDYNFDRDQIEGNKDLILCAQYYTNVFHNSYYNDFLGLKYDVENRKVKIKSLWIKPHWSEKIAWR